MCFSPLDRSPTAAAVEIGNSKEHRSAEVKVLSVKSVALSIFEVLKY